MAKTILVVDDDRAVHKAFAFALEEFGYHIEGVYSGDEAVEAVERLTPDLLFLDLKIPGMDGIEVLRRVRRCDSNLPIYIITSYHEEFLQSLRQARKDGLTFEVAEKPLGDEQIRKITTGILEARRAKIPEYHLRLYFAGHPAAVQQTVLALEQALEAQDLPHRIEVVDVLEHADEALAEGVFATPTLIRLAPEPAQRVVGDLSDARLVLEVLGVLPATARMPAH